MRSPSPLVRFAVLAAAWACAAGCASARPSEREPPGGPGLSLGSARWYPTHSNDAVPETGGLAPRRSALAPPITPADPWLGEIGLRQRLAEGSELGCGVAVPNRVGGASAHPDAAARVRDFGVGIWWKFDF